MKMDCLFGRCRTKQKQGFDLQLTPETAPREVAVGPESAKGTIRMKNPNKDLETIANDTPVIPAKNLLNVEQDEVYNTVTSYPPMSLSNSVTSLVSLDEQDPKISQQQQKDLETTTAAVHTFKIEKVEPSRLQLPPLLIPAISIVSEVESELPQTPNDDLYTPTDYSNQSTITSGNVPNGLEKFRRRESSPPQSPPIKKGIPVPENTLNHIRLSFFDENIESGTESEDGGGSTPMINVIENIIAQPIDRNARKEGVISDKIDQKEVNVETYQKSEEDIKMIKNAITENDFLNNMMDEDRLNAVIEAMKPKELEAGTFLITEGETGSSFYVSAEGDFEVIKETRPIKNFGKGVVFGELAILYKAKRFASIKVTSNAKVWLLERKVFQKIMMNTGRKEQLENVNFLKSVSIFKDLSQELLEKVSELLMREFFASGSRIIQQGDPGDKFYIIRGGTVDVVKTDEFGQEKFIGKLTRGSYFGEQALLNRDKRLASIIACPPGTECLTLDRMAFENYLGGVQAIKDTKLIPEPEEMTWVAPRKRSEYEHLKLRELKLIGILGVGGYGRVELVQNKGGETFALKCLKKYEMVEQQQQKHVFNEKEIMLTCDSPFIVKLYRTFRDNKYLYLLMEPCLGGDVWTILHQKRFFDERITRFMAGCVVEAFEYLHTKNIFYRDLKPENLMLDSRGYVKLVDFGFAKYLKPNDKTWTFAGTPEYVAPEIITNKGHNRAVDYWALGILIFELLVGKPPFRGRDHMKTYNFILRGIDAVQFPQKVPKKAQALIKRLCRQSPTERLGYQKNGIADIKNHPWFAGFDWPKLHDQTMSAPLVLPVSSNIDLSNFEKQDPYYDDPPDELSGWDIGF